MIAKRIRAVSLLVMAAAICLGLFSTHTAPAQAQLTLTAIVNTDQLYLRSAASRRGEILAELARGDQINVTGRSSIRGWGYGSTANGAIGWFAFQYVEIVGAVDPINLPILPADAPVAKAGGAPAGGSGGGQPPAGEPTAVPPNESGGQQPPASPPEISAPPSAANVRGFELGGQINDFDPGALQAMRSAGMTWIKKQAKEGDGAAFGYISAAKGNGFKILLSVIGNKEAVTDPSYQDAYAGFVGQLAAAGADAIEVWNEQNIDREWKAGSIDPSIYVQLLAKSYAAIKSNNPATIVITGAPAPTGAEAAFGLDRVWNDDRYATGMARAGAARYADCIGLHYNEGIVSPNQRSGDPRGDNYPTRYYDGQVARGLNPFGGKKGCFTELGYLSPEGYGPLPGGFAWAANTTIQQHATWLAQAAQRAANSGKIRLMIVFNVNFNYYGGDDPQAGYAMIRADGSCPACEALGRVMGVR